MRLSSINPATGALLRTYPVWTEARLESMLAALPDAAACWSATTMRQRAALLLKASHGLRQHSEAFARLITKEMGKLIVEARAEIDKCAWICEYFAEHGGRFLAEEAVATEAARSYIAYEPLGTVLAIMPWNFPFWQVFRAAVPALLAGNAVLLKHAPTVTGCALAVEQLLHDAGWPAGSLQALPIRVEQVQRLLADPRIHGLSFTGSLQTGREVGKLAGANIKKAVLELGGSDPFIVLEDADLERTVAQAIAARFGNAGQSCIAAKRFIVIDAVADEFVERFRACVEILRPGDPLDESTTLAPLARADLRDALRRQVAESLRLGAVPLAGCVPVDGPGYFYPASILDRVQPGMAAFDEEVFGPVAAIVRVRDEAEAVDLANHSRYGLGGSVWTADTRRGERVARRLHCGMSFVNAIVKSDPRLPCGGIKDSGHGRELAAHGIKEFTNVKTVWIAGSA